MSIPQTYEEWKYCITQRCQIKLSPVFIQERLEKLADQQEAHTREYIRLYGEAYYQQMVGWFRRALMEQVPTA
jgi:hypothetical protein